MIPYSVGDFIFHPIHGVGLIRHISDNENPDITIDFEKKPGLVLPRYLLDRNSDRLSPLGYRVLAYTDPIEAHRILTEDPVTVIELSLYDFPTQRAKTDELKDYLSPYLHDWDAWWEIVQPKLKESSLIDTSRSKFREYGLHQEQHTRAEEAYRYFRKLQTRGTGENLQLPGIYSHKPGKTEIYDQARRVLKEITVETQLSKEDSWDLRSFFIRWIADETNPIALRLDAIFRLSEIGWYNAIELSTNLHSLLNDQVRLYQLEIYTQNRLLEYLLSYAQNRVERRILCSGICGLDSSIQSVKKAALERADPEWIQELIIVGLTENLPPELLKDQLPLLGRRLEALSSLVKSLPVSYPKWSEIIEALNLLLNVLSLSKDPDTLRSLPYNSLMKFSIVILSRINEQQSDLQDQLLNTLSNPNLSSEIILGLLEAAGKLDSQKVIKKAISPRLISRLESQHSDLLNKLLGQTDTTKPGWEVELVDIARNHIHNHFVVNRVGTRILELCRISPIDELVRILPSLEELENIPGDWDWRNGLNTFRQKAYQAVLQDPELVPDTEDGKKSPIWDPAITSAFGEFLHQQTVHLQAVISSKEQLIGEANKQIQLQKKTIADQESIMRELRSGLGGDTQAARFDERRRVLRELATTLAEFERFTSRQGSVSSEMQAILRRLNNLLAAQQVIPLESIGTTLPYDPKAAKIIEGEICSPGDMVFVVERGYKLRDPKGAEWLLKQAIVQKVKDIN